MDVIGLSILSGAHVPLTNKVIGELRSTGALEDVMILVGGNIYKEDIPKLKDTGVSAVFPTGSEPEQMACFIKANIKEK